MNGLLSEGPIAPGTAAAPHPQTLLFCCCGCRTNHISPIQQFFITRQQQQKKNDGGGPSVGVGWGVCSRVGRVSSTKPTASACVCARAGEPVSGAGRVGRGGYDFILYIFCVQLSTLLLPLIMMTARDDDDGAGGDDDVGGHPRFSDRPGAAHVVNSHVTLNVPKCFVLVGLLCGHVVLPPAAAAWGCLAKNLLVVSRHGLWIVGFLGGLG